MNPEDLLFYADEILILYTSPHKGEKFIQIFEEWNINNKMKLNKEKPGIVVFARRAIKFQEWYKNSLLKKKIKYKLDPTEKKIKGIPICQTYE